jgi:DNA-binding NtrC family response regulator
MGNIKIMVIDDEEIIADVVEQYFSRHNYNIKVYTDEEEALEELRSNFYDIVVADYKLQKISGIDLLEEAKKRKAYAYGILFTAYFNDREVVDAAFGKQLVSKVVEKPFKLHMLKAAIDEAIREVEKRKSGE